MKGLDRLTSELGGEYSEALWDAIADTLDDAYLIPTVRRRYEELLRARYPKSFEGFNDIIDRFYVPVDSHEL